MFRQRLKGGHKVGAHGRPGIIPQPTQQFSQHEPPPLATVNAAWNWDASASDSNSNIEHSITSSTKPNETYGQTQHVQPQTGAQPLNGEYINNQSSGEWNWGNEDSWDGWEGSNTNVNTTESNLAVAQNTQNPIQSGWSHPSLMQQDSNKDHHFNNIGTNVNYSQASDITVNQGFQPLPSSSSGGQDYAHTNDPNSQNFGISTTYQDFHHSPNPSFNVNSSDVYGSEYNVKSNEVLSPSNAAENPYYHPHQSQPGFSSQQVNESGVQEPESTLTGNDSEIKQFGLNYVKTDSFVSSTNNEANVTQKIEDTANVTENNLQKQDLSTVNSIHQNEHQMSDSHVLKDDLNNNGFGDKIYNEANAGGNSVQYQAIQSPEDVVDLFPNSQASNNIWESDWNNWDITDSANGQIENNAYINTTVSQASEFVTGHNFNDNKPGQNDVSNLNSNNPMAESTSRNDINTAVSQPSECVPHHNLNDNKPGQNDMNNLNSGNPMVESTSWNDNEWGDGWDSSEIEKNTPAEMSGPVNNFNQQLNRTNYSQDQVEIISNVNMEGNLKNIQPFIHADETKGDDVSNEIHTSNCEGNAMEENAYKMQALNLEDDSHTLQGSDVLHSGHISNNGAFSTRDERDLIAPSTESYGHKSTEESQPQYDLHIQTQSDLNKTESSSIPQSFQEPYTVYTQAISESNVTHSPSNPDSGVTSTFLPTEDTESHELGTDLQIESSNFIPTNVDQQNVWHGEVNQTADGSNLVETTDIPVPHKPSRSTILKLHAREESPFQPPSSKCENSNVTIPPETGLGLSQTNANLDEAAHLPSPLPSISDADLKISEQVKSIPLSVHSQLPSNFSQVGSVNHAMNQHMNSLTLDSASPNENIPQPSPALHLSQSLAPSAEKSSTPSFSRMIPGESTEAKSNVTVPYHAPAVVPAMPSGRFVTGNDNPHPVPSVKVKQEPSEVRSPPDGPESGDALKGASGVIPPIRSETIGSEVNAAPRTKTNDISDDEKRHDRGPRGMDNRDRSYYSDRYGRERRREHLDYYRSDYDSHYDRSRHHHDSEEDSEGEVRRRGRDKRDRRPKHRDDDPKDNSYRDDHRNRSYRYNHGDDDPFFDRRSDRSQPMSRSSSYGNLVDSETSPSGHHDEYYDRGLPRDSRHRRDNRNRDKERDGDYGHHRKGDDRRRDPYSRGYPPYHDHYGAREMYDPQSYYHYYQNYQKYLEQNPYYRDYYRQYYGRYGMGAAEALPDDKASSRSGRSSVNDEMKKSSVSSMAPYDPFSRYYGYTHQSDVSSQFRQDFLDQSSLGGFEQSPGYVDQGGNFSFKALPLLTGGGYPSMPDDVASEPASRMTPQLFMGPHLRASFTPGGKLLLMIPNNPMEGEKPIVQVRNVQKMLSIDPEYAGRIQKMQAYPGPLSVTDTHKDIVLRYCEEKATTGYDETTVDRDSFILLWQYLFLLVKQNGNVSGADLANLLIKTKSDLVKNSSIEGTTIVDQPSVPTDVDVRTPDQTEQVGTRDTSESVAKFTEFLCLGRKKEAVEFAVRQGLWGYAMTLAAKMDSVTHARVMSSFVQTIPNTDVLQTLIQHLSGKKPEVSKNYNEERWGNWRQHLAMLVSNPTGNLARDQASIVSLGDTLASVDRIFAAHICYLAAGVQFGSPDDVESAKLLLLGSSARSGFKEFASDDAIRCTEIFEFAKSLEHGSQALTGFQFYKFTYAVRLAECGYPKEALKYCEVISQTVHQQPQLFTSTFVSRVLELGLQLKYYDDHYQIGEGEISEMGDPHWLQSLQELLHGMQYHESQLAQMQGMQGESGEGFGTAVKSEPANNETYTDYGKPLDVPPEGCYPDQLYAQTEMPVVSNQVQDGSHRRSSQQEISQDFQGSTPQMDGNEASGVPMFSPNVPMQQAPPIPTLAPAAAEQYMAPPPTQSWHQPQQNWYPGTPSPPGQGEGYEQPQETNQPPPNSFNSYHPNQWHPNDTSQSPGFQGPSESHDNPDSPQDMKPPVAPIQDVKTTEEEEYWAMMRGKAKETSPDSTQESPKTASTEPSKTGLDDKGDEKKSQGFLGSLFGGWRKGPARAKLPDDKNPTIVWDEQKNKWINTDEGETEETPLAPPPIDSKLAAPGGPPMMGNLKAGGTRKSRYVDPVSTSSRTNAPAPMMPPHPATTPPMPGVTPPMPGVSPPMPGVTPPMPAVSPSMPGMNAPMPGIAPANSPQGPGQPMEASQAPMHNFPQGAMPHPEAQYHRGGHQQNPGIQQGADGMDPNAVPMMNPDGAQPQPMFFNPAQFRGPSPASNQPKRVGPSRRTFNQN